MTRTKDRSSRKQSPRHRSHARRVGHATFRRINERQIALAGPRYTPSLDPTAPNLEIRSLVEAFDALGFTAAFRARVRSLRDKMAEEWSSSLPSWLRKIFRGRKHTPERLIALLTELEACDPTTVGPLLTRLRLSCTFVLRRLRAESDALAKQIQVPDSTRRSTLESRRSDLFPLTKPVSAVRAFLESLPGALLPTNIALLRGSWGTGKTHTLCDLAKSRQRDGYSTLLCLAQSLPLGDPTKGVARLVGVSSLSVVLRALDALGRKKHCRALLCIDAINEGDRSAWRKALPALCREMKRYPHVGLVLSCRTPFDREITTKATTDHLVILEHPSFEAVEANAQLAFFDYYKIPAPPYPLIIPEFTRPLFLKLFCQSLQRLSTERKELFLGDVISGHAGMTTILERMVKEQGSLVEKQLKLSPSFCWLLMKNGLAPVMASSESDCVSRSQCLAIIQQHFQRHKLTGNPEEVLQRLVVDGLLIESLGWDADAEPSIHFPYQRFGEHLVARYLMREHLDTRSAASIRRSFHRNRPLGRVFVTRPGGGSFAMQGLASAIMLEFPERTKRTLRPRDRELVFSLPRHARGWDPVVDAFLDGLQWRQRDSFNSTTRVVISQVLKKGSDSDRRALFDVLLAMSCRSAHPYSAKDLWRYLASQEMADRDLTWSEAVRSWDETSSLVWLLAWCAANASTISPGPAAYGIVRALALCLTTVVRPLRDRLTKALFDVGLQVPDALFDVTIESLAFNDPYVPERLLAASYGVAMRGWAATRATPLRAALPRFAKRLARQMFAPGAPYRTCHSLMNGYAFGIIDLAQRVAPRCLPRAWRRRARVPLYRPRSPFRAPPDITVAQCGDVEGALHMDFNNYTLGRLVSDRSNYDSNHPDYQRVRRQVMGRMYDLGYRKARFEELDRSIGRWSWHESVEGRKTDRYGKKYSWIAFFEMHGLRAAAGLLDEYRSSVRPSDCDIDPSFPEALPSWRPRMSDVFTGAPRTLVDWMNSGPAPCYDALHAKTSVDGHRGPWLALDALIGRQQPNDPRGVLTFVRAVFVRRRHLSLLTRKFAGAEYPGNFVHQIPEDHYTYGGEIPWSSHFGTDLRTRSGRARRSLIALYSSHVDGRWVYGPRIEVPVHGFGWESYHSELNQAGRILYPSPAMCDALGLFSYGAVRDLYDRPGRLATLYRIWNDRPGAYFHSHVLYLRRDLLHRYLRETGQCLAWLCWGDRGPTPDAIDRIHEPSVQAVRSSRRDVFRQVRVYDFL